MDDRPARRRQDHRCRAVVGLVEATVMMIDVVNIVREVVTKATNYYRRTMRRPRAI